MGYQTATFALAPLFALQARWIRRAAQFLPEPPGPRAGVRGQGPALRLLIVGDSAAAGVGAPSQDEALSGRLVDELALTFRVSWMLIARTGATAAGTARHLAKLRAEECAEFDVAVLSIGANDVMTRRPMRRWVDDVSEVVTLLHGRFGVRHIVFSGLPPIHLFTALPQPLRWYLGVAARRYDGALARWAAAQSDCEHVPLEVEDGANVLAPDGLHPSPPMYRMWSIELARFIRSRWT